MRHSPDGITHITRNGKEVADTVENITSVYRETPELVYPVKYFNDLKKSKAWENAVGTNLAKDFDIQSAVDFGCAAGYYLEGMYNSGVSNVQGYDYLYHHVKHNIADCLQDKISFGNLMEPIDCGKFDCAMSVEVAEHILPEHSETLVKNLVNASSRLIIFTAAPPGQRGTGHINCRPKQEWIELFKQHGANHSNEWLKMAIESYNNIPMGSRYRNAVRKNLMCFDTR